MSKKKKTRKREPEFSVPYLQEVYCGTAGRKRRFVEAAVNEFDDADWNLCSDRVRRDRIARFVARMVEIGWQVHEDYVARQQENN